MELMKEYYESYKEEARIEFGEKARIMTFEEFCDFYEVDETTEVERIFEIFAFQHLTRFKL